MAGISEDVGELKVNREDFLHALDEVHPAFGVSEEELEQVIQNGIINFDVAVDVSLLKSLILLSKLLIQNVGAPPVRPTIR